MLISNVHIQGLKGAQDIYLEWHHIKAIVPHTVSNIGNGINMNEGLAFPGLINSHDHLDFNCFPLMGNGPYENYRAWGTGIQSNNKESIAEVMRIPQSLRMRWGLYKNLLNGVTTVVEHGKKRQIPESFIDVFQHCQNLHSTGFEKGWRWKLNDPSKLKLPVVMHVGEGTDTVAQLEPAQLSSWNLLRRKLIAVHAVSMTAKSSKGFAAITWCPATNYFLLGTTAPVEILKNELPVLFGTDSTLTADWNIWSQLRTARATGKLTDAELQAAIFETPAATWDMKEKGSLLEGKQADIVIAETGTSMDDFYNINPEKILLVIQDGNIRLFDEKFLVNRQIDPTRYSCCTVNGRKKYVPGNIVALVSAIKQYYPGVQLPVTV